MADLDSLELRVISLEQRVAALEADKLPDAQKLGFARHTDIRTLAARIEALERRHV